MSMLDIPLSLLLYLLAYPLISLLIAGIALVLVVKSPAGPERGLCLTGIGLMLASAVLEFLSMPLWFMSLPDPLTQLHTVVAVSLNLLSAIGTALLLLGLYRGLRRAVPITQ